MTKHFHACCSSLGRRRLKMTAQDAVCVRFTAPMFYWGAATLSFRLFISVTQFLRVDSPYLLVLCARCCRLACFSCWIYIRSFVNNSPFCIDLTGYACLIAWFGLKMIGAEREIFGISPSMGNPEVPSSG
jgi:hypothetical protein